MIQKRYSLYYDIGTTQKGAPEVFQKIEKLFEQTLQKILLKHFPIRLGKKINRPK